MRRWEQLRTRHGCEESWARKTPGILHHERCDPFSHGHCRSRCRKFRPAAPAGLAASITTAALSGTAITTTAVISATKAITMTTLQKTVIGGLLAAALGTGIYGARQMSLLRAQGLKLRQQNRSLTEQTQQLTQERDELASKLAGLGADKEQQRRRKEHLELMSLRGRVTQLADQVRQLKAGGRKASPLAVRHLNQRIPIRFSSAFSDKSRRPRKTLVAGGWSLNGMRALSPRHTDNPGKRRSCGWSAAPNSIASSYGTSSLLEPDWLGGRHK